MLKTPSEREKSQKLLHAQMPNLDGLVTTTTGEAWSRNGKTQVSAGLLVALWQSGFRQ